jgi:hypothetical protein
MNMKSVCKGVVSALIVGGAVVAVPLASPATAAAGVVQNAPVTTTLKGTIKTIDQSSVVLVPSGSKSGEVTFQLTPSVKRSGDLAAGGAVTVTYYYEKGQRVVTALAGKASAK